MSDASCLHRCCYLYLHCRCLLRLQLLQQLIHGQTLQLHLQLQRRLAGTVCVASAVSCSGIGAAAGAAVLLRQCCCRQLCFQLWRLQRSLRGLRWASREQAYRWHSLAGLHLLAGKVRQQAPMLVQQQRSNIKTFSTHKNSRGMFRPCS
jgi:hypothetical protein